MLKINSSNIDAFSNILKCFQAFYRNAIIEMEWCIYVENCHKNIDVFSNISWFS